MTRRASPMPPEPPWVWGPAEVNEWIRSAHPSDRRHARSVRKGPEVITRLRMVVEGSDTRHVRTMTEEALQSIGLAMSGSGKWPARRRVLGTFRRSLVGERTHVSLRFEPPIHVSSCKRIVERLGGQVHAVSVREGRARLPTKSE